MEYPAFNVFLGGRVAHRGDGEATIELDLKPHHLNQRRVVHGGVISALLDSALGLAVISSIPKEWWCATIALNIQFMSGKGEGTLTAKGRVTRRGKRVAFAEGEILDERGRTVARATGNWHLWNYKPGERRLGGGPWVQLRDSQETLPVGKILAVGRNYAAHNVEMGNAPTAAPIFFLKPSSAILHDGGRVELPSDVGSVHHEVELVAVIGKPGRAIEEADALDHVLGYAVGLDLTLRDLQSEAKKNGEPWSLSKGFDGSAPISTVVPAESVGDGSGLGFEERWREPDVWVFAVGVVIVTFVVAGIVVVLVHFLELDAAGDIDELEFF